MKCAKVYLGDSVYVEVDRGIFKLTTENGYGAEDTIYLEVPVYKSFVEYAKSAMEEEE